MWVVVCDTAKVRFSKQITTKIKGIPFDLTLFAILQKYDFPSKSQPKQNHRYPTIRCLRYCKSTIFQANHNYLHPRRSFRIVVCDTAKVRFSKQITTIYKFSTFEPLLFAILQKYDFPSKSQLLSSVFL